MNVIWNISVFIVFMIISSANGKWKCRWMSSGKTQSVYRFKIYISTNLGMHMLLDREPVILETTTLEYYDVNKECWAESKLGHVCMRIYKEGMCEVYGQFVSLEECTYYLLEKMRRQAAGIAEEYEDEEVEGKGKNTTPKVKTFNIYESGVRKTLIIFYFSYLNRNKMT